MNKEIVENLLSKEKKVDFTDVFLTEYLKDGFASLSKRSIDLLVFHLIESMSNLESKDNSELSILFQIPDSKIKVLRYESKLKYIPLDNKYIERKIAKSLSDSQCDLDAKRIKFIIEDTYVRKYLAAESKRLGGVPDYSFNSEIISLKVEHFTQLLNKMFGDDVSSAFEEDYKMLFKEGSKITFDDIKNKFALGLIGGAGSALAKAVAAYFSSSGK